MRKSILNYLPDLVEASFNNDNNSLESIVISLIRLLAKDEDNKKLAEKLSKLLSKHQAGLFNEQKFTRSVPDTSLNDSIEDYVFRKSAKKSLNDLILNNETKKQIDDIIISYRNRDRLDELGIKHSQKIIFNGPPGTGKSSIGEALAHELELSYLSINVPALFSSYLGDSGKTITRLFSKLSEERAIIVFDEFDSIAVSRSSSNDVGEMRRIVNSVLTSLDNWNGEGLIIATTNAKEHLDNAVWRRFDQKLEIELPDKNNRYKLWGIYCKNLLSREELGILSSASEGFSPAEIEIIAQQGLRMKVIKERDPFLTIIGQLEVSSLSLDDRRKTTILLKKEYPKLTTREIGLLMNVSKSSVQRYLKEGELNEG